ncbi:MAG: hypothetical protein JO306_01055 [Gemmatimonadetes bacterium]|nr:hypothetical protein [Gemmatimonadota bacterium]
MKLPPEPDPRNAGCAARGCMVAAVALFALLLLAMVALALFRPWPTPVIAP